MPANNTLYKALALVADGLPACAVMNALHTRMHSDAHDAVESYRPIKSPGQNFIITTG
jgi:hypothetical protein